MNATSFLRYCLTTLLLGLLAASALRAQSVTINFVSGHLYDDSGVLLPTNNLVLLIADTSGNGFGALLPGSTLNAGDFLNSDDQILGRALILGNGTGSATGSATTIPLASAPYTTLTSGDPIALIWFSMLTGSSTVISSGNTYGLFSNPSLTATVDGDPWVIPSSGSTIDLNFKTLAASGTHAETAAYATLTAIPEPATYAALAGLFALTLAAVRRRTK
ncbi:MAG: hypothetical protein WC661_11775 [Opitutaceae bacterium]|jgi:hypothetical protein